MPSSGTGTGTPISGGVGVGLDVAIEIPYTLLSLPRYAKIMGINPAHFAGAAGTTVFPVSGTCSSVWTRYAWQNSDAISHEDLARAILDAEFEIANYLGYWPGPKWIPNELHQYPRHYRPDIYGNGRNVRGQFKSLKTKWGKVIQAGRRAVTLLGTATTAGGSLAYTDEDGDGFAETATVTMATTLTDVCEIKVYFTDKSGMQEWEIRPYRSKQITGGNAVIRFDSWLFIDPDLLSAYPTEDGIDPIPLSTASYVSSVDVYREYTDFTVDSAEFYWEPGPFSGFCTSCGGSGCVACTLTAQGGCVHIRDSFRGFVVPTPSGYDADEDAWVDEAWTECREPDQVKIWYYAGELDDRFLQGYSCEPLSDFLAHPIAWLATARLERPLCACNNVFTLSQDLRKDLAFSGESGSYQVSEEDLANPFGTRKGEIMAWKRISSLTEQIGAVAAV